MQSEETECGGVLNCRAPWRFALSSALAGHAYNLIESKCGVSTSTTCTFGQKSLLRQQWHEQKCDMRVQGLWLSYRKSLYSLSRPCEPVCRPQPWYGQSRRLLSIWLFLKRTHQLLGLFGLSPVQSREDDLTDLGRSWRKSWTSRSIMPMTFRSTSTKSGNEKVEINGL